MLLKFRSYTRAPVFDPQRRSFASEPRLACSPTGRCQGRNPHGDFVPFWQRSRARSRGLHAPPSERSPIMDHRAGCSIISLSPLTSSQLLVTGKKYRIVIDVLVLGQGLFLDSAGHLLQGVPLFAEALPKFGGSADWFSRKQLFPAQLSWLNFRLNQDASIARRVNRWKSRSYGQCSRQRSTRCLRPRRRWRRRAETGAETGGADGAERPGRNHVLRGVQVGFGEVEGGS